MERFRRSMMGLPTLGFLLAVALLAALPCAGASAPDNPLPSPSIHPPEVRTRSPVAWVPDPPPIVPDNDRLDPLVDFEQGVEGALRSPLYAVMIRNEPLRDPYAFTGLAGALWPEDALPGAGGSLPTGAEGPAAGGDAASEGAQADGLLALFLGAAPGEAASPAPRPEPEAAPMEEFRETAAAPPEAAPVPAPLAPAPPSNEPAPAALVEAPAAGGGRSALWVIGMAVAGASLVLRLFGIGSLLTRIPKNRVAENPVRARILEEVARHPGIHFNSLGRQLGISNSQKDHHVRALVEAGLLVRHASTGYICLFPAGSTAAFLADLAPILRTPRSWLVMEHAATHPGATTAEARERTRMSAGTFYYHLRRLSGAGLVRWDGRGPGATLRLTERGEKVRGELGPLRRPAGA